MLTGFKNHIVKNDNHLIKFRKLSFINNFLVFGSYLLFSFLGERFFNTA